MKSIKNKKSKIIEDELDFYIDDSFVSVCSLPRQDYWNCNKRHRTILYKLTANNRLLLYKKGISVFQEGEDIF